MSNSWSNKIPRMSLALASFLARDLDGRVSVYTMLLDMKDNELEFSKAYTTASNSFSVSSVIVHDFGMGGGGSLFKIASRIPGCPPSDPDNWIQLQMKMRSCFASKKMKSASPLRGKSLSPKGVRFGEAVETIGSKYEVGLPLAIRVKS
ncbi:hypothetical protein Tco_1244989 [Tanacetum coccineum]